jgi:hypothetical protein
MYVSDYDTNEVGLNRSVCTNNLFTNCTKSWVFHSVLSPIVIFCYK